MLLLPVFPERFLSSVFLLLPVPQQLVGDHEGLVIPLPDGLLVLLLVGLV
jgi:hypothetical protein